MDHCSPSPGQLSPISSSLFMPFWHNICTAHRVSVHIRRGGPRGCPPGQMTFPSLPWPEGSRARRVLSGLGGGGGVGGRAEAAAGGVEDEDAADVGGDADLL